MSRIAYTQGHFIPERDASVPLLDRGYLFSDGIYEVMAFYGGNLLNEGLHLDRLERSLASLFIPMPMARRALGLVIRELIRRNERRNGLVYLQVTRGAGPRSHQWAEGMRPVLSMLVMPAKIPSRAMREEGVRVITTEDLRWTRRDIKSISLLGNILAKQEAAAAGVFEAWQVEEGHITEGSLSNAYIINAKGELQTHPDNGRILGGVTRSLTLHFARERGITLAEKPFTAGDLETAKEAFLTSCSSNVLPIVRVDDRVIGNGMPGATTRALMQDYEAHIKEETGFSL